METINEIILKIDEIVWGPPLIILLIGTGILLSFRLGFIQISQIPRAFRYLFSKEEDGQGEVSSFASLCTALSATIGTGNIVGVATAIYAGGPGALFWMIVAAFFGMATKYTEGFLAVKYRETDKDGHILGGPFYYIEKGMGMKWKWLAKLFAFFGAFCGIFGIGTISQINGITSAVKNFFDPDTAHKVTLFGMDYSVSVVIAGVIITVLAALVIMGGLKRISGVATVVVPFMAITYVLFCIILLVCNITAIPAAFAEIISGAFDPAAVTGGAVGSMITVMQKGIARGIFSNESGIGSAPIASAAASTKEPARQGLVSMLGTFIDTIIICTMTGLCIVITDSWNIGLEGVAITTNAFQAGIPFLSDRAAAFILMVCLVFFAFTTILGWDYYGERCVEYLGGKKGKTAVRIYRILYIAAIFAGPYITVAAVWNMADISNGLMAFPNLIALIALSGIAAKETKDYLKRAKD